MTSLFKRKNHPQEVIIEPMAAVNGWQLARVIGNEAKCLDLLKRAAGMVDEPDFLSDLLKGLPESKIRTSETQVVNKFPLDIYGYQFLYQKGSHKESLLIGSPSDVIKRCQAKTLSAELNERTINDQFDIASRNGFLAMAVAWTTARGGSPQKQEHQLLGLAIFAPSGYVSLNNLPEPTRLFSLAHPELVVYLCEKLWPKFKGFKALNNAELSASPSVWRRQVQEARVIGEAPALTRLNLANFFRTQGTTVLKDPYLEVEY